jgi:glyoxylase-like metal-dependent hydrolase (beta-lactamase superfamily II)
MIHLREDSTLSGKSSIRFSLLAAVSFTALSALAQSPPNPTDPGGQGRGGAAAATQTTQQIKPGLFVITGAGGNTTVRVTPEGLIVVDTKNLGDQFYNALAEQIKGISPLPVKYVVVTHHHQDHSGNIQKFLDSGATVIAHENLKANLVTDAPQQGKPSPPSVTYTKDYTIKLGGAGPLLRACAHERRLIRVLSGPQKVLAGGDSIVGAAPNVDFLFGGSAVEWVKVLDSVSKLDFDTVVPGHSSPTQTLMTRADFEAFKTKLDMVVSRARDLVKNGTPKEELLAKIKTDDIGWNLTGPQWNNPQRLDAFYAELSK